MASATEIAYVTAAAMLDNAINDRLNSGTSDGIINIYTGSAPANCEAAETGTLLGTLPLNSTPFGAAADLNPNARITANAIVSDTTADATGVAGYFRAYSTNTAPTNANKVTCFIQGSAGEAADSTDLTLDDKNIVAGGTIAISAWTITMPEA